MLQSLYRHVRGECLPLFEVSERNHSRGYSPPCKGGVAVPSRKRIHSDMARPGWSHKSRCSIRFETWCVSDHPVTPPVPGGEHPRLQIFKRPHYQLSESLATLPHFGKIRCSKIHKKPGGLWLRFTPFTRTLSCPNKFSTKTT